MLKDIIIAKLKELNYTYEVVGQDIKTKCLNPAHNDNNPSFYININDGRNHCFSCNYAVHPSKLFNLDDENVAELLRDAKYKTLLESFKVNKEEDVKEFVLPPIKYKIDRSWRGVSLSLLERLGAYYCDRGRYAGRLVFPIYGDNEELQGVDARIVNESIVPDNVKHAKWLRSKDMDAQGIVYPLGILKAFSAEKRKHIIITEGLMDAISYIEIGVPAIPTFGMGAPSSKRIETLLALGVETITIGYDNDEKGIEGSLRVYPYYKKWFDVKGHWATAKVRKAGHKDANEALQAGALK